MQKLLIADPSEEFCAALASALSGLYEIRICRDGNQAMDAVSNFRPDCLVLDLMLPGMDGISFLQAVSAAGLSPLVLPISSYFTDYITYALQEMGILYMMQKPCKPEAVASRLVDLQRHLTKTPVPEDLVSTTLLMLGLRTDLCGYQCVRAALAQLLENPGQPVTKLLYPAVAQVCGGSAARVERAIRTAIRDAWLRRDARLWQLYFTHDRQGRDRCPSNSVFLFRLAASLYPQVCGGQAKAE